MNILIIALTLSIDAFSIALIKGFLCHKLSFKDIFIIAFYFGLFQGIMPILGYYFSNIFYDKIVLFDHYIILIILGGIGVNMILSSKDNNLCNSTINFKEMFILAIATSIDAFTMGITLPFLVNNILIASFIIALITFLISLLGVIIGHKFGTYFKGKAEIVGGILLIFLALKIFLSHI